MGGYDVCEDSPLFKPYESGQCNIGPSALRRPGFDCILNRYEDYVAEQFYKINAWLYKQIKVSPLAACAKRSNPKLRGCRVMRKDRSWEGKM